MAETLIVRIPKNTDFTKLHNPYKKNLKRGNDLNAYLLGLLIHKSTVKEIDLDSFHSLHSSHLRGVLGGNYKKYINKLIQAEYIKQEFDPYEYVYDGKLIKCTGDFKKGQQSCRYAQLKRQPVLKGYTITDKNLIDKINLARVGRTQRVIKHNPTAKLVYQSMKLITIDTKGTRQFLYKKYNIKSVSAFLSELNQAIGFERGQEFLQKFNYVHKSRIKRVELFKEYGIDVNNYKMFRSIISAHTKLNIRLHHLNTWDRIQKGEHDLISIAEDKRKTRLYDNFSMTPKDLIPFMRLQGQPLIEADGNNSQLWMLLKLCNLLISEKFYKKLSHNKSKKSSIILPYTTSISIQHTCTHYKLHSFLNKYREKLKNELEMFENLLYTNQFRKMFVDHFKSEGKTVTENQVKIWFFENILFANPRLNYNKDYLIVKKFKSEFPSLWRTIKFLKLYWLDESGLQPKRRDKDGTRSVRWKCLPIVLTKMESDIFVKDSATLNVPFLQRHDALFGTAETIDQIAVHLSRSAEKRNIKFTVKIK